MIFYQLRSNFTVIVSLTIFLFSCGRLSENSGSTAAISSLDSASQVLNEAKNASEYGRTCKSIIHGGLPIRLNHHVNTTANEYVPVMDPTTGILWFTGMDRTGFFDFKIDYTKAKSSGGEDIYNAKLANGILEDARPVVPLNTNGHESVSHITRDGALLITANYPEKLGPKAVDNGTETTDLFLVEKSGSGYKIRHFDEPVNSIYNEADALGDHRMSYLLFVSDRPGHVGDYHKKGWLYNGSCWGNTDVWVTLKKGDAWTVPINLGAVVNSPGAERTPWLSEDGLKLYLSSNGYEDAKEDLDIYMFTRKSQDDWTNWEGPFKIENLSSSEDDWGYKEYPNSLAFFSRAIPLGFKPTQPGRAGDGFIRETNFRTGYTVIGAQVASLKAENNSEIYMVALDDKPALTLPDLLFKFDSYELNPTYFTVMDRLVDFLKQNIDYRLKIVGHTDNIGTEQYNQLLSEKRAESIKNYLASHGILNQIDAIGLGKSNPLNQNRSDADRARNRRIEFYFD